MDENKIMELMDEIEYGWLDSSLVKHLKDYDTFVEKYILESPEDVLKNKVGVCWDQVELERYYFKEYNIKTFFIVCYDNALCPTHTFLVYEKNNKYYWFEHSWSHFRGIHEYNRLEELLKDVKNKFVEFELKNNVNGNISILEYSKPKYHITVEEFYKHCENGKNIDLV